MDERHADRPKDPPLQVVPLEFLNHARRRQAHALFLSLVRQGAQVSEEGRRRLEGVDDDERTFEIGPYYAQRGITVVTLTALLGEQVVGVYNAGIQPTAEEAMGRGVVVHPDFRRRGIARRLRRALFQMLLEGGYRSFLVQEPMPVAPAEIFHTELLDPRFSAVNPSREGGWSVRIDLARFLGAPEGEGDARRAPSSG